MTANAKSGHCDSFKKATFDHSYKSNILFQNKLLMETFYNRTM